MLLGSSVRPQLLPAAIALQDSTQLRVKASHAHLVPPGSMRPLQARLRAPSVKRANMPPQLAGPPLVATALSAFTRLILVRVCVQRAQLGDMLRAQVRALVLLAAQGIIQFLQLLVTQFAHHAREASSPLLWACRRVRRVLRESFPQEASPSARVVLLENSWPRQDRPRLLRAMTAAKANTLREQAIFRVRRALQACTWTP